MKINYFNLIYKSLIILNNIYLVSSIMDFFFRRIRHNFNIDDAMNILRFSIKNINRNLEINNHLFNKDISRKLLRKIRKIYKYYSDFLKSNFNDELKDFLKNPNEEKQSILDFDEKLISYMIIVYENIYYQTPRLIQIICLLYYLEGYVNNCGLILEVLTGEGKTLTISFLALYLAIFGNKVDILTSSPVLAERDAKSQEKFYNYFGISCDFCRRDSNNDNGENMFECYRADIVYGDGVNLIGDILRHDFMGKKGRGNRSFDYIIIDEIDNICIDNLKNIVELVDNFPGFKYLEFLYLFIYKTFKEKIDKFKKKNKKLNKTELDNKLKENAELMMHEISIETYKFLDYNKSLKYDDEKKILIPENSYDFIEIRIDHWCRMAYEAMFTFKKNANYFISKDERLGFDTIKPIDYVNTGVILKNSVWSGLHQFLQIKEGMTFTEENINSSFMSYLSFFRKYKIINGITGTLGSKKTQQAINEIYKINLLRMPPFKTRALEIYEPRVFPDEKMYEEKLVNEIVEFSSHFNRVVLVIFEYMNQVTKMQEFLDKNREKLKLTNTEIIEYTRSDIENKFLEKEMRPNTVILSTNLSGRGTDIKINSDVKRNGGLHVIITFMPYNERIEKQAQGRAGRCGDKGSSVTMIFTKNNYKTLESRRIKYELEQFKFLINLYVPELDLNQKFFDKFCQRLQEIKNKNNNLSESIVMDLKERWSMFILKNNINSFMNDKLNAGISKQIYKLYERISTRNFNALMKDINVDIKDYKFKNPFYQMKSNLPDEMYKSAIEKSPDFSIGAYYNQAYYYIINQNDDFQIKVFNDLKKLKKLCEKFIYQYELYIKMFNEIHNNDKKKDYCGCFVNQCLQKKKIMECFLENVDKNIKSITDIIYLDNKYNLNNIEDDPHFRRNIKNIEIKIEKIKELSKNDFVDIDQSAFDYFRDFGISIFYEIKCEKITLKKKVYNFVGGIFKNLNGYLNYNIIIYLNNNNKK